jgi:hypothetical protein
MEVDDAGKLHKSKSAKRRKKKRAAKAAKPAFTKPAGAGATGLTPVQRQQARIQHKHGNYDHTASSDSSDPATDIHADRDAGEDTVQARRKSAGGPMQRKLLALRDGKPQRLKLGKVVAQRELDRQNAELQDLKAKLNDLQRERDAAVSTAAAVADVADKWESRFQSLFDSSRDKTATSTATVPSAPAETPGAVELTPVAAAVSTPAAAAPGSAAAPATTDAAPSTYRAAAVRGLTTAEAARRVAEAEENVASLTLALEECRNGKAEAEARLAAVEGKTFLQALAKPSTFTGVKVTGKPALSVRDWILSVQDYTESLQLSTDRLRVAVAESYLGGDAKRDWHTKRKVMLDSDTAVTWDTFMHAIIDSWDPACSDVKARMQLEKLSFKGNMTTYVSQFDRLCSFIPKMNSDERVHKFLYQIQATHPHVAQDLQTDPSSKERWTDYHALRKYALHTAATEVFVPTAKRDTPTSRGRQNDSRAADRKRGAGDIKDIMDRAKRRRGVFERLGGGGGEAGSSAAAAAAAGSGQGVMLTNTVSGERHWRSNDEMKALSTNGRKCAWCWGPGSKTHHAAVCNRPFKRAPPAA